MPSDQQPVRKLARNWYRVVGDDLSIRMYSQIFYPKDPDALRPFIGKKVVIDTFGCTQSRIDALDPETFGIITTLTTTTNNKSSLR